ncbi:MAG: hypothetical protein LUQ26_01780 [Methylococcaceae bacterium]|nr:hypothetical protein [Methylococcaceae bacterium]
MPYKNKADRNVAHEVELEKTRPGAHEARMIRQKARRKLDAKGVDRTGKDIDHVKGTKAGNGADNLVLKSPSANRSFQRNSDSTMKANKPPAKKSKLKKKVLSNES